MTKKRTLLHIPYEECTKTAYYLQKHTGIDLSDIPDKYGDSVLNAQKIITENLTLTAVFDIFPISSIEEEKVTVAEEEYFTGKMAPKILQNSQQVICFVVTLPGFNELHDSVTDIMENYFMDTWGTVYTEAGEAWLRDYLKQQLKDTVYRNTPAWNPGQHQFELSNQRPLFNLLKPEDTGCTLDKHLRMIPFKSTSGIMGIVPKNISEEQDLIPCDFCSLGKTCPASKSRKRHGNK